jgi:cytochrome c-type biogenesis protein CcmH
MNALLIVASLLLAQHAPQRAGSEPLSPELEERVQRVGKELRCAVCQGLSIADSPASMARAQLDKVRELVAAGKTDQEIRDFFVARYGEWALLRPSAQGITWFVWVGPVAALVFGIAFIVFYVQRRRPRDGAAPVASTAPPEQPSAPQDPFLHAVREELDR